MNQSNQKPPAVSTNLMVRPRRWKAAAEDRQLHAWIYTVCDPCDIGTLSFGAISRPSDNRVEAHLNSKGDWRKMLQPLPLCRVAMHRRGNETLFVAPKRQALGRCPSIVVSYTIPFGDDPAFARLVLDWLNHRFHDGLLYYERCDRALYAYAVYDLPAYRRRVKGRRLRLGKGKANEMKANLQAVLDGFALAYGWKSRVQVLGSFTETENIKGILRVPPGKRGELLRAPRCARENAVARLLLSHFGARTISNLVRSRPGPYLQFPLDEPLGGGTHTRTLPRREFERMLDALLRAMRARTNADPLPAHPPTAAESEAILETAAGLLGEGQDPIEFEPLHDTLRSVLRDMLSAARLMGRRHQAVWWGPMDLRRAERMLRRHVSNARLLELNQNPKLIKTRVTITTLALVLVTIAKNVLLNAGAVPTKSIRAMLEHWRIPTHGSHVKILLDELIRVGLVNCTQPSYRPGRWCRRYAIPAHLYSLPFLADCSPWGPQCATVGAGTVAVALPQGSGDEDGWQDGMVETLTSMKFLPTAAEEHAALHPDVVRGFWVPDDTETSDYYDADQLR